MGKSSISLTLDTMERKARAKKTMVNDLEIEAIKLAVKTVGNNAKKIVDFLITNPSVKLSPNTKAYYGCVGLPDGPKWATVSGRINKILRSVQE